jgi:hypothetical protein
MVKCKICSLEFKTKRALAIHVTKSHKEIKWKLYKRKYENSCINKPFICELCNSCYATPRGLTNHLLKTEKISLNEYYILFPSIKDIINNYYKTFLKSKYTIDDTTKCWNWDGYLDRDGYGFYNTKLAHRLFYEMYIGDTIEGLLICHKCDNPQCVNPNHLYMGTSQDNMDDMVVRHRSLKGNLNPAKRKDVRRKISENNSMLKKEHRDKISKQFKGRKQPRYNYIIISPTNKKYQKNNLFKFCNYMNLNYRPMLELSSNQRTNYNGWMISREVD